MIYITTQEFNKLTADNFAARLKQANVANKYDIADFAKNTYFDDKLKNLNERVTLNKTKPVIIQYESKEEQDKIKKITNI